MKINSQCFPYPDCDSLMTFSISMVLCFDKGRSCLIALGRNKRKQISHILSLCANTEKNKQKS